MQQIKAVGPRAAALKYDILTALMTLGLHDKGVDGRLAQRLALLMTARFSWRTETFSVGIREIARLWGVTERTAKRDMALMRARGWIVVHRNATRGRVTEHRVVIADVLNATRLCWPAVGPDFVERMGQGGEAPQPDQTVVPFPNAATAPPAPDGSVWGAAAAVIHARDPALYAAWFTQLREVEYGAGRLILAAPSRFIGAYVETHLMGKLLAAVTQVDASLRDVRVISG